MSLKVFSIAAMDRAGKDFSGKLVEGFPENQIFLQTVFSTKEGEESQLTESGPEGFFVVRVDEVTPPTVRSINTVRAQIIESWKAEQRAIKSKKLAIKMLVDLNVGKTLSDVAGAFGIKPTISKAFKRNGQSAVSPLSAELVKKVFSLKLAKATEGRATEGYQVVVLKRIIEANPSADKKGVDTVRNSLTLALKSDVKSQLTTALRQEIDVDINRPLINQLFNSEQQNQ